MRPDDLDTLVEEQIDQHGPGVVVAVVKDGQLAYERGYGLANLEWGQPMAMDTVLGLGSLTKPFTAQAVLLLELSGKLRIEDAVVSYLPDLTWLDPNITIAHLLTHTSGIANYVTQPGFWERIARQDHAPAELATRIGSFHRDFAPGERYSYSNSGYALLGMLIEAVSEQPYDEYVRVAIFEPLGMQDSCYLWDAAVVPRRAGGYQLTQPGERGQGYQRAPYLSATLASAGGGLGSTLGDLVRWDTELREHQLLPAAVDARMRTPVTLNDGRSMGYGLGWGLSRYRGRTVAHHAGGVPGFSSFFGRFLADELTIIVLSNLGGFDAAGLAGGIATHVLKLSIPARIPAPVMPEHLAAAEGLYTNRIGERLEVACAGEQLTLRGDLVGRLIPLGNDTFASAESPDVTVHFTALGESGYARAMAVTPFYWFEVERAPDEHAAAQ
jgi:CubicO group peptidase (beta-lactamase class C family)